MGRVHTHRTDTVYSHPAETLPEAFRRLKAKLILSREPGAFPENAIQEGFVQ